MKKNMLSICGLVSSFALTLTATASEEIVPVKAEQFLREWDGAFRPTASEEVVGVGGRLQRGIARPPTYINLRQFQTASPLIRESLTASPSGPYSPAQIRTAYGINALPATLTGSGQTIGLVEAYGDPSIQADLNNFCKHYGIPSTTVQVIYPDGQPRGGNSGWALETAVDVEWAHAIAPGARIVVSVAASASLADLLGAVDGAVSAGATVISMSWGMTEFVGQESYDSHFDKPGVTFVASSGDSGELSGTYKVEWPAVSPYVIGVGGTDLYLNSNNARVSETAWPDSGGGVSEVYGPLSCQAKAGYEGNRGVPDVSYVAGPNTGVGVVYGPSLYWVGGTSIGAPQWAALIALTNAQRGGAGLGDGPPAIYNSTAADYSGWFQDITSGCNGTGQCAGPGYDLVTGMGSPAANVLVPNL
jgi:subtilase family serine protease